MVSLYEECGIGLAGWLEVILEIGYNTIQTENDLKIIYNIVGLGNICRPLSGSAFLTRT